MQRAQSCLTDVPIAAKLRGGAMADRGAPTSARERLLVVFFRLCLGWTFLRNVHPRHRRKKTTSSRSRALVGAPLSAIAPPRSFAAIGTSVRQDCALCMAAKGASIILPCGRREVKKGRRRYCLA